jgi:hypothetical protein
VGFVVDKAELKNDFSEYVAFPASIPQISPHSSSSIIIRGWYNRPVIASVIMDSLSLHPKKGEKRVNKS